MAPFPSLHPPQLSAALVVVCSANYEKLAQLQQAAANISTAVDDAGSFFKSTFSLENGYARTPLHYPNSTPHLLHLRVYV